MKINIQKNEFSNAIRKITGTFQIDIEYATQDDTPIIGDPAQDVVPAPIKDDSAQDVVPAPIKDDSAQDVVPAPVKDDSAQDVVPAPIKDDSAQDVEPGEPIKTLKPQLVGYYSNYSIYASKFKTEDLKLEGIKYCLYAFAQVGNALPRPDDVAEQWNAYKGTLDTVPKDAQNYATGEYKIAVNGEYQYIFSTDPNSDFLRATNPPYGLVIDWNANNTMSKLIKVANESGTKALLSLGGWSCSIHLLYAIVNDQDELIDDIVKFISKRVPESCQDSKAKFHGVDIDLEPYANDWTKMSALEVDKYVTFLEKLKVKLPADQSILTIAIGATADKVNAIAKFNPEYVTRINKAVDSVFLMTYDFHGAFDDNPKKTNLQSPLYQDPKDPHIALNFNIHTGVEAFASNGVEREKLFIGIPAYGRSYKLKPSETGGRDSEYPGLYEEFESSLGEPLFDNNGDAVVFGSLGKSIKTLIKDGRVKEFNKYTDDGKFVGSYAYGNVNGNEVVISYDNAAAVIAKAEYVESHGLGGLMMWELRGDIEGELFGAAHSVFDTEIG